MERICKVYLIRSKKQLTVKQRILSIIFAFLLATFLGLLAKLGDSPDLNPIFSDMGGRLGIWVFMEAIYQLLVNHLN